MKTNYLALVQAVLDAYRTASDSMISTIVACIEASITTIDGKLYLLPTGLPYVEAYAPRLLDSKLIHFQKAIDHV